MPLNDSNEKLIKGDARFSLQKLSQQQKSLILTGFLIVLSALMIFFVILPAVKEIKHLNEQITHYKMEIERKYQERFNVRHVIENLENAKKLLPSIESSFIPKDGEIEFVESLEKIADKHSLTQQLEFQIDYQNKNKFLTPLDISLTLEGDYFDILNYLEELEKHKIYINFQEILMTQRKNLTTHLKGKIWEIN